MEASVATLLTILILLFSSSINVLARPLHKLNRPVVLLISSDGFRFGYQSKTRTPNIHQLIATGTEAKDGLIPVFPTITITNHYSIVTGLYPPHHGIILNKFTDPVSKKKFRSNNTDPYWWLGEPLWETVVKNKLKASTLFWPGSEVRKGHWTCPPKFCPHFNSSFSFQERVNTILGYFDLPVDEIPSFMTLYFDQPDTQAHIDGPDHSSVATQVANIDAMIGKLIDGLKTRGVYEDVHLIMVGDHGMVNVCDKNPISLHDLSPWIEIPDDWVESYGAVLAIRPSKVPAEEVVAKMTEGLSSGEVENGMKLKVYLKEKLPPRLHYNDSVRIPPVIGILEEGYTVKDKYPTRRCGEHGYDNAFKNMRSIFIGHGPLFEKGRKVESFENVHIYNIITSILNIPSAPNNGSASVASSILKPTSNAYQ